MGKRTPSGLAEGTQRHATQRNATHARTPTHNDPRDTQTPTPDTPDTHTRTRSGGHTGASARERERVLRGPCRRGRASPRRPRTCAGFRGPLVAGARADDWGGGCVCARRCGLGPLATGGGAKGFGPFSTGPWRGRRRATRMEPGGAARARAAIRVAARVHPATLARRRPPGVLGPPLSLPARPRNREQGRPETPARRSAPPAAAHHPPLRMRSSRDPPSWAGRTDAD